MADVAANADTTAFCEWSSDEYIYSLYRGHRHDKTCLGDAHVDGEVLGDPHLDARDHKVQRA